VNPSPQALRDHARAIWQAAVAAARPEDLLRQAFADPSWPLLAMLREAPRILVVGGGKAGAAMSAAVEEILADCLPRMEGVVNVPAEKVRPLRAIRLHAARPAGTNQPTAEGVEGTRQILELVAGAGPQDVALCLLSGGGSALLPAPVEGVTLADKQHVTRLLHACGATINEMNAVRKHLSRFKGGRLAQQFPGRALVSLIISDVIGDPLDVIASGPTAPDPTTFADVLALLAKYRLLDRVPAAVRAYLERGAVGLEPDTPKVLPAHVTNHIIGNNTRALAAASRKAEELGYPVLNLGSFIEGETQPVATALAGVVRSIRADGVPAPPPVCLLSGGETTVTLSDDHGLGGRNQEFVLAAAAALGPEGLQQVVILSGGTDGEDGPTDAAGAVADEQTWRKAEGLGLSPNAFLARHDAYHFFEATGDLIRSGLTETNVMDVRVMLVSEPTRCKELDG
jgi:hydroxypyruvate reductase/glycerate 2-kinase